MLQNLVNSIDPYTMQILVNIGIGIILALGLNIITGLTGQLSLGHAAFMSVGAFTGALLTIKTGMPFSITILLSGLITAPWRRHRLADPAPDRRLPGHLHPRICRDRQGGIPEPGSDQQGPRPDRPHTKNACPCR